MDKIKICKYSGSPFIWQQGLYGEWILYYINTENGICFNYLNEDEDYFF